MRRLLDRLMAALPGRPTPSPAAGEGVSHGDAPDPAGVPAEVRAETWDRPDGSRVHLLVASARGATVAHALVRAPDGRSFRAGTDVFGPGGIDACGDALVDALALFPVDRRDVARLRLLPPEPARLVRDVANLLDMLANHPLLRGTERTRVAAGPQPLPPRHPSGLVDVVEASDVHGLHTLGHDARTPLPAPARTTANVVTVLDPCTFPQGPPGEANRAVLGEVVLPWFEAVRADLLPPDTPAITPGTWTAEYFSHHRVGGEAGRRRAQAAALHPGLAPVVAHVPALSALVDAGRPFEDALARELAALCGGEPLSPARMRRLRTLAAPPPATGPGGLRELVDVAASLPVDRLPLDAAGWDALVPTVGAVTLRVARRHRLDLADLLRGLGPGFGLADLAPENPLYAKAPLDGYHAAAVGIDDMVNGCAANLVALLLPGHPDARGLAARILLAGRTMRSAVETQGEWHRLAVEDFERRRDGPRQNLGWPALFAPYRHDSGVVVRCLTSTADLVAEGGNGADADGIEGLSHCVGGYDRQCAAGQVHVASVRLEGRRTVRISTVEIHVRDPALGLLDVGQHRGHMNAPPHRDAEAAVEALLRDVAQGLHAYDRQAATPRKVAMGAAAALNPALAFDMWRPLMTRRAARAGLPGLLAEA